MVNSKSETKSDLFKRMATMRTRKALRSIKVLGNCANRKVYDYNTEDVDAIFSAVENEVKRVKAMFEPSNKEFSL